MVVFLASSRLVLLVAFVVWEASGCSKKGPPPTICSYHGRRANCGAKNLAAVPNELSGRRVTEINLSFNRFSSLSTNLWKHLGQVNKMTLSFNKIPELTDFSFGSALVLRKLDLEHNVIQKISRRSLAGLSQLRTLNLNYNRLSTLPQDVLAGLRRLESLSLVSNSIRTLPEGLFRSNSRLQKLDLSRNSLQALPEDLFVAATNLQQLKVANNHLTLLPSRLFRSQYNLRELNLQKNQLRTFPFLVWSPKLNVVNFEGNPYTSLPSGMLEGTSELQVFDITGGRIKDFRSSTFLSSNAPRGYRNFRLPKGAIVWDNGQTNVRRLTSDLNVFGCERNPQLLECLPVHELCPSVFTSQNFLVDCTRLDKMFSMSDYHNIEKLAKDFNDTTRGFIIARLEVPYKIGSLSLTEKYSREDMRITTARTQGSNVTQVSAKNVDLADLIDLLGTSAAARVEVETDLFSMSRMPHPVTYEIDIKTKSVSLDYPVRAHVNFPGGRHMDATFVMHASGEVEVQHGPLHMMAVDDTYTMAFEGSIPPMPACLPPEAEADTESVAKPLYSLLDDVVIDTLYFDLKRLKQYISARTRSILIRADTVVLSMESRPLRVPVTVVARKFVLMMPLGTWDHDANNPSNLYHKKSVYTGDVEGVRVHEYHQGLLRVLVVATSKPCTRSSCSPPANLPSLPLLPEYVLHLMMTCSLTLQESANPAHQDLSADMRRVVGTFTAGGQSLGMSWLHEEERKVQNIKMDSKVSLVPYLELSVYQKITRQLSSLLEQSTVAYSEFEKSVRVFSDGVTDSRLQMEDRGEALRVAGLRASRAVTSAKTSLANQRQLTTATQIYLNGVIETVRISHQRYKKSLDAIQPALQSFREGAATRRNVAIGGAVLGFLNVYTSAVSGLTGITGDNTDAVGSIQGLSAINDIFTYVNGIQANNVALAGTIGRISRGIENIDNVIDMLPETLPLPGDSFRTWMDGFSSSLPLVRTLQNLSVSSYDWQITVQSVEAVLSGDFAQSISGASDLEVAFQDVALWAQATMAQMKVMAELLVTLNNQLVTMTDAENKLKNEEQTLQETRSWLRTHQALTENDRERLNARGALLLNTFKTLFIYRRSDVLFTHHVMREFCQAYYYFFLEPCPESYHPRYNDSTMQLRDKVNRAEFSSFANKATLNPAPLDFKVWFMLKDKSRSCQPSDMGCPVTSFKAHNEAFFYMSDWWPKFSYFDRIRIFSIQVVLDGVTQSTVNTVITKPTLFNDTLRGQTMAFQGLGGECRNKYEQANGRQRYIIRCDEAERGLRGVFSQPTPYGVYRLHTLPEHPVDVSQLSAIKINIHGSLIPGPGQMPPDPAFFMSTAPPLPAPSTTFLLLLAVAIIHHG